MPADQRMVVEVLFRIVKHGAGPGTPRLEKTVRQLVSRLHRIVADIIEIQSEMSCKNQPMSQATND